MNNKEQNLKFYNKSSHYKRRSINILGSFIVRDVIVQLKFLRKMRKCCWKWWGGYWLRYQYFIQTIR